MVFTGVFERFPTLKFIDTEVNAGWVPFWIQMIEQEYERQRHWADLPISQNPAEYLGKNLFVTVLDDYVGFESLKTDDRLATATMFSTDYPHSATLFPKTRQ